jgi:hypothetical protein
MLKQKRQQECRRYEIELQYYLLDKVLWKTVFVKAKSGVILLHRRRVLDFLPPKQWRTAGGASPALQEISCG